jgi:hypothetical protein
MISMDLLYALLVKDPTYPYIMFYRLDMIRCRQKKYNALNETKCYSTQKIIKRRDNVVKVKYVLK